MEKQVVHKKTIICASIMAILGLCIGGVTISWIAGSLGISAVAAERIVNAVEIGGWAIAIFCAGIGGAVVATTRWFIATRGRAVAVA